MVKTPKLAKDKSSKEEPATTTTTAASKPAASSSSSKAASSARRGIVKSGNAGNSGSASTSTAAASSSTIKPDDGRPPPLFPAGYKTPLSLLNERCQKNGWQKPDLQPFTISAGSHGCVIRLSRANPKLGGLETITFRPPTSSDSPVRVDQPSALEAKHWGAVYALHRFASGLQMGMVLPPQVRDYWAALQEDKKHSGKKDEWMYDPDPFEASARRERDALEREQRRIAEESATSSPSRARTISGNKDAPEVFMPSGLRALVQDTIRKMRKLYPPVKLDRSAGSSSSGELGITISQPQRKAIMKQLQAIGYREGHITSALEYIESHSPDSDPLLEGLHSASSSSSSSSSTDAAQSLQALKDTVLQYLHITLTEEELPDSSAHGYAGRKEASIRIAASHGNSGRSSPALTNGSSTPVDGQRSSHGGLREVWLAEKIVKEAGYPAEVVEECVRRNAGKESETLQDLMARLVGWPVGDPSQDAGKLDVPSLTSQDWKEVHEKREMEIEALDSILGSDVFCRIDETTYDLHIPSSASTSASPQAITLRIVLDKSTLYPSPLPLDASLPPGAFLRFIPIFYISSSSSPPVPPYIRLHLASLLLLRLHGTDASQSTEWRDIVAAGHGGVLYEMYNLLLENIDEVLRTPPRPRSVMRHLTGLPDDDEDGVGTEDGDVRAGQRAGGNSKPGKKGGNSKGPRRPANAAAVERESQRLHEAELALSSTLAYQRMASQRRSLPANSSRTAIVDMIAQSRVVIVSGSTGSGKTTQVPAYVLEDAIARQKGGACNIVVTQPRRISAIGVAARVADERCESVGNGLVGYAIRGERKASKDTRLLFCTTGILLQRLARGDDPDLKDVSHVFVDEVHERSLDSDFLLLILKQVLLRNKEIKVVLMSATADSERFSAYFSGAPCITIPGRTHPVTDYYLEDVIQRSGYKPPSIKAARKYSDEENAAIRASLTDQGIADQEMLSTLLMLTRAERVDYDMIARLVGHLMETTKREEAILIFVTGVAEITQTIRAIERLSASSQAEILPLHANLTSAAQSLVFKNFPAKRKIIVSTNIAETSITVDDVVYVIDSGRVKETRFNSETGLQTLTEDWNSLAGAQQRRGRAGRTKPGVCYKLFSRYQEANVLPKYTKPEILRTPLASLVLQIKSLVGDEGDVKHFLAGALDAPKVEAVQEAIDTLQDLGALTVTAVTQPDKRTPMITTKLTPLGANLAMLPLDLRLGKMLIYGCIFSCLERILLLCSILSSKPIFSAPPEKRDELQEARMRFSTGKSDLLTDLRAAQTALAQPGQRETRKFCEEHFMNYNTLREIVSLRMDYVSALRNAGFAMDEVDLRPGVQGKVAWVDGDMQDESLIKAIIFAGTGKAVRIKLPQVKYEATIGGTTQLDHEAKQVRFFDTDGRVFIHPGSILFSEPKLKNGYLTYFSKSVTSKPFLRDATELPLFALLIFGRALRSDPSKGGLSLTIAGGSEVHLRSPPRTSVLMNELRRLLDAELERMIDDPSLVGSGAGAGMGKEPGRSLVVRTMVKLLEARDA